MTDTESPPPSPFAPDLPAAYVVLAHVAGLYTVAGHADTSAEAEALAEIVSARAPGVRLVIYRRELVVTGLAEGREWLFDMSAFTGEPGADATVDPATQARNAEARELGDD